MTARTPLARLAGVTALAAAGLLLTTTAPAHATDVNYSTQVICTTTSLGKKGVGVVKFSTRCKGTSSRTDAYRVEGSCGSSTLRSGWRAANSWTYGDPASLNCPSGFSWIYVAARLS